MISERLSQSEVCVKARQKDSLMISLMVSQRCHVNGQSDNQYGCSNRITKKLVRCSVR